MRALALIGLLETAARRHGGGDPFSPAGRFRVDALKGRLAGVNTLAEHAATAGSDLERDAQQLADDLLVEMEAKLADDLRRHHAHEVNLTTSEVIDHDRDSGIA